MMSRFPLAVFLLVALASPLKAEESGELVGRDTFAALIQQVRPSIATIRVNGRDGDQIAMGTGFVIDESGLIATNFHVITEGRPFTVEMSSGRKLPVVSIESSDRNRDLAIVRVNVEDRPLKALTLSADGIPPQGSRILAFGNPLGMRDSVVVGIVSAVREIDGREMIQLAMPVQPGNSGGPLVDLDGNVIGIINMKSAIDDNLGFAIPIAGLGKVREQTNPVAFDRWVVLGRLDDSRWKPLFGSNWQQRGGLITARGLGTSFGGRSLCLSTTGTSKAPHEITVQVRLNDESGAAGIAFHSDGKDKHYGFYVSGGQLRLTCFQGPSVFSWQILDEQKSEHYLPQQWNRLRVRIEPDRVKCFVNGHLVIESTDRQLRSGQFGLVKFRNTEPDFKGFEFGNELTRPTLSDESQQLLTEIFSAPEKLDTLEKSQLEQLGQSGEIATRKIANQIANLESQAEQLRRLSADVIAASTLNELAQCLAESSESEDTLLRSVLLIAKLDNPDIDIDAYQVRVDAMAKEISEGLEPEADAVSRREALHTYLFQENGFHGGSAEYYHPANSHLNRVIDDREGLPITLSILYMELGRRLGLSIEGVGLPGRFVVRQRFEEDEKKREQLIDVFDRGAFLSKDDAGNLVASFADRPIRDDDLRSQTTNEILRRVLTNLIGVAGRQQDGEAIHRYCEALVAIEPGDADARWMRAQIRVMTSRHSRAVEDLNWLIEEDPLGFHHAEAVELYRRLQASGDVSPSP